MVQIAQALQVVQVVCPHPDLPPRRWKEADSSAPLRGRLKRGGSPVPHSVACRRKRRNHPTESNAELGDGLNGLNDWNDLNKRVRISVRELLR
jgi:hypothetical protein